MPHYNIGLDLGQAQDYTAMAIVERFVRSRYQPQPIEDDVYHVVHLERFPLGTSYPDIVDRVDAIMKQPQLRGHTTLVVDATGVGRPVVDMMDQRKPGWQWPVPVTITGGDEVQGASRGWRVPKRDLAGRLQVLLQSKRLKIAEELPLAEVLMRELLAFRVKINIATGHDSYEAWRERDHDDLVLAVALAVWRKPCWGHPRLLDEQGRVVGYAGSLS